ncbi:MAG: ABC transporter ATP-binding protein [Thermoleophilia bacterium]
MTTPPGTIVAEGVGRSFRVSSAHTRTLKESFVRRGRLRSQEFWALRDVSFAIEPGEAVGVIGRNGSGKTTLLRLIARIFQPSTGRLQVGGTVGSLLSLGAGFHPEFTGRENVYLSGSIYGLPKRLINERFDEIVAFAELEDFIDQPVRTYSSGMFMRLGFAIATHLSADVLLLDEVFAVGDESFQRKCFGKVYEFKSRGGTILFVSHGAAVVESLCERAILLREGQLVYDGSSHSAIQEYQQMLAEEEDPAERAAGLREWGSREVSIGGFRLEDVDGRERLQYLSGEPLVVRFDLSAARSVPAARVTLELRDRSNGLIGSSIVDLAEIGWGGSGDASVRFVLERLPVADGRFTVAAALTDESGKKVYHRLDQAASFLVYPDADVVRGWLRLDGRWTLDPVGAVRATR